MYSYYICLCFLFISYILLFLTPTTSTIILFCSSCAMVSCASCVCKRVFEVISRQIVSICVHCYRESSRVRQPPQVVANTKGIKESVKGKWWRPEDLGIVDYSQQSLANSSSVLDQLLNTTARGSDKHNGRSDSTMGRLQSTGGNSLYNDQDMLIVTDDIVPLVPGLLDGIRKGGAGSTNTTDRSRSISPLGRRGARESVNDGMFTTYYKYCILYCIYSLLLQVHSVCNTYLLWLLCSILILPPLLPLLLLHYRCRGWTARCRRY